MIDYSVRESPRAKNVYLKLSLEEGLVVVVPRGFDRRQVPALVAGKRVWIDRAAARLQERQLLAVPPPRLPRFISLSAITENWQVEYRANGSASAAAREQGDGRLLVAGCLEPEVAGFAALQRWLARKARQRLTPWLLEVSGELELPLGQVAVRNQRCRWASCSPRHTISLNQKLLFLPAHLVEYIFIHELCHTVHLNHSRRFWRLVAQLEPEYRQREKELRQGWRYLPGWAGL